jgi:hypothetical protein
MELWVTGGEDGTMRIWVKYIRTWKR